MSIKRSDLLLRVSSFWWFYRWHPEVAIRYLPVVSGIKSLGENITVLEIGSGGLGIAPYLRRNVVGVDTQFHPPFHPLLKQVKGSAIHVPFGNNTYDVVISVDTLEHLKKEQRERAIGEMIRVAKKKVIIAVPSGKKSYEQDKILDVLYKQRFGSSYIFLKEQIEYGLPEEEDFTRIIKSFARRKYGTYALTITGNENLKVRSFLMKGWMTKNRVKEFFFRKLLLLFIPFLTVRKEPTYRKIFTLSFSI